MLSILNSSNAHYMPIFQPILMKLVSKFMVYRALTDQTYLSLGLLSPLRDKEYVPHDHCYHHLAKFWLSNSYPWGAFSSSP